MKKFLSSIVLILGLMAGANASADDVGTVLNPVHNNSGYTETSRFSVAMPRANTNCGWSINDYVRNCGRSANTQEDPDARARATRS